MRQYINIRTPDYIPAKTLKRPPREGNEIVFSKPKNQPKTIPYVHVFEMDLTYRTKRILWHLKISTLEQLANTPIEVIKAVRGSNKGTTDDIKRELQRFGVQSKGEK